MEKLDYSPEQLKQKREYADITTALAALRKSSARLRDVPDHLLRSGLYVCAVDPAASTAWDSRGENGEQWAGTLQNIASMLEQIIHRIDVSHPADDDAELRDADEVWKQRVARVRQLSRLPDSLPAAMIVGGILSFVAGRPADGKILRAVETAEDAADLKRARDAADVVLARVGRQLEDALAQMPAPALTTGSILDELGVDAEDLSEMSPKDFAVFKRQLAKTQRSIA